ncbi:prominin family protein [Pedobacter sp. Leaf176]|nr:prominin family protein [Pedobacter sp. Leaf176]
MKKLSKIDWFIIVLLVAVFITGFIIYQLRSEPLSNGSLNGYPM